MDPGESLVSKALTRLHAVHAGCRACTHTEGGFAALCPSFNTAPAFSLEQFKAAAVPCFYKGQFFF